MDSIFDLSRALSSTIGRATKAESMALCQPLNTWCRLPAAQSSKFHGYCCSIMVNKVLFVYGKAVHSLIVGKLNDVAEADGSAVR